jgi:hypothetical protein
LWAAFDAERPRILGVLLDAVVEGLKRLPETRLEKLPRMADFALWASACEMALWPAGTFWSAYCGNRDEAVEGVIDADPIAAAVRAVMATRTEWTGTASDLLGALAEVVGERVAKSKTWPDGPRAPSEPACDAREPMSLTANNTPDRKRRTSFVPTPRRLRSRGTWQSAAISSGGRNPQSAADVASSLLVVGRLPFQR